MVVMDRVGGYLGYQALCEDMRAYEDVLIAMQGEAEAQRLMEARSGRK